MTETITGFLLTRQWRDKSGALELVYWFASEQGPVRVAITGQEAVCFVHRDAPQELGVRARRRPLELTDLAGNPVDALYFKRQRELQNARYKLRGDGVTLFESDLKPSDRYLMERFITGACAISGEPRVRDGFIEFLNPRMTRCEHKPTLKLAAIDIECEGLTGELYSIAVACGEASTVFLAGATQQAQDVPIVWCANEVDVLTHFFAWLEENDPDVLIGWNVANFDLDFIEKKCAELKVPFTIARNHEGATVLAPQEERGNRIARIPGRVVLDGIELLRAAFWTFESFELEVVAHALLGRGKTIHSNKSRVQEIQRLFKEDPVELARYNLEDCRLVEEIFAKAGLLAFAVERAELTGLALDRYGGSVAAFDNLYLPHLHRRGRVAFDIDDVRDGGLGSPGGYVLDSAPGLYDDVLVFDFKSLYPSIIRTFKIDPYGLAAPGEDPVPGFLGAHFSRHENILPELITSLWQVRERAKRDKDAPLSQAVKILMNSFYGVLGSTGCRFYDPRLASSITRRGHEIIQRTRELIEQRGHHVIYGDTDSLFVLPKEVKDASHARSMGAELAAVLNTWWAEHLQDSFGLESHLEMEFETHFLRFLMPTIRGAETGSKKRYAGLVRHDTGELGLIFKGLESVRTDWTPLAQRFQRELYRRVFANEPYADFIRETLGDLLAGNLDHELVYRKRLRRALDQYTRNVPPHVQAARKLENPGKWIRYVITRGGPEPVRDDLLPAPDYRHYEERQLAPAANGILHFLDTSFENITSSQLEIF